ncbi:VOC family protein [Jannaschia sp. CCS1]|uniref:VOC family protein n=1 Tax=Jannaschia sp. (strain CCS1) TaxID=290400 RepID=UPI000053D3D0|nr:VOC family protein [Jannaschia sp. CCS1]ABD55502.1 Glyoxalase/bleomycin resistance protein/dioxygenase [Jannaschia sp. CCS1]
MSALVTGARLDHVHLCVADRAASVQWYARVLDLHPLGPGAEDLADDHPLFLAPASAPADHCLSLFTGPSAQGADRNVAFRVDASALLAFLDRLPDPEVMAQTGGLLSPDNVNDYGLAMTLDFLDPDGNELELVCYDAGAVRAGLGR